MSDLLWSIRKISLSSSLLLLHHYIWLFQPCNKAIKMQYFYHTPLLSIIEGLIIYFVSQEPHLY